MAMTIPPRVMRMLDYRIILFIAIAAVGFHILGSISFVQDEINAVDILLFAGPISCVLFCSLYLKKYGISRHLERSILLLGLAFASMFAGDLIYLHYDISGEESPFLSSAYMFYSLYIPLIGASVVFSMLHLSHKILNKKFLVFVGLSCVIGSVMFYVINLAFGSIHNTDYNAFVFGLASVAGTSAVAGMILYHLTSLGASVLGVIRMVMLAGLLLNVMADMWYYSLESIGSYTPIHPVDTIWFASWMIIGYSVYLQIKKF